MLIRRDRFTVLPMPDLVVNYLDNMAEKRGAAIELKVEIGDRDINDNSSDLDATDTKILEFIHGLEATFFKVKLSTYMYNPVEASLKADTEDVQVTDQNPRFLEQMMMQPQVTLLAVSSFDNDIQARIDKYLPTSNKKAKR